MTGCRGIHLLLQHPLVYGADRVLRPAEHLRPRALRRKECELCDCATDAPLDSLGAERKLVVVVALAPLGRAVRVADRHAHDRDRRMHTSDGSNAGNTTTRADDHLAADLLAQDAVRRADVVESLRSPRRGLQPEPVLADRRRRLVDNLVVRRTAISEREVVARKLELDVDHIRGEDPQSFLEELLTRLVTFEDDNGSGVAHGAQSSAGD